MAALKCLIALADGYVGECHGIEHEGKLWLVPAWNEHPKLPIATPVRIIRFDDHSYQRATSHTFDYENILLPMPQSALLGQVPADIEFIDHPQSLSVPIHRLRNR